jgi:hypothetical protein
MQTCRMLSSGLQEPQGRPPAARHPFAWSIRYCEQLIARGNLSMVDDGDGKRFLCVKYRRTVNFLFLIWRQLCNLPKIAEAQLILDHQ